MYYKFLFLVSSVFVSLTGFSQDIKLNNKIKAAMEGFDKNRFMSHITYLADDRLKGRQPGQEGFQIATEYVVDQYKKIGLIPAGDNGTYLQKLILRRATLENSTVKVFLKDKSGNEDTLSGRGIFITPHPFKNSIKTEGQLVFVGYGLEIPGKYSDYAGIDVKGKIVIVISSFPQSLGLPSTLAAHFSNAASKMEIAASKGAIGFLLAPAFSGPSPQPSNNAPSITLSMRPDKNMGYSRAVTGNMDLVGRISFQSLQGLFMNSGINLQKCLTDLRSGKAGSFLFPTSLHAQYGTSYRDFESHNIIGMVEGSDNVLKNEYVVHSAHLDHVGIGNPVNGDSIYNGAHDNASGVASLLEIARIYKAAGSGPKRSILFIMMTAEEMGLLGSAYFANNPTVPKSQIVANVNTDMPTLIAPLLSVAPLGAEHSSLEKNVAFATRQLGIEMQKDPLPDEVRFVRSDQYNFVLQGIPALHIKYGIKTSDPSVDLVKVIKEWTAKHYHKPSDDLSNTFNLDAAKTYVQLNFLISYSVAQTIQRPAWNKGDFFEYRAASTSNTNF